MLSGHVHGEARRTDVVNGRTVFQMLADYQDRASGGEGWLRILRFVPGDNKIYVQTYSPWLNRFETDADSEFSLDFPMGGAFVPVGSSRRRADRRRRCRCRLSSRTRSTSGGRRSPTAAGRRRTGPVWRFTTGSAARSISRQSPSSQSVSTMEDTSAIVTLTATDPEGSPLTFTVVSGPCARDVERRGAVADLSARSRLHSGRDRFTFRANDGQANSTVATVSITSGRRTIRRLAVGESYSVTAGSVLNVSAPGVLGNDSDIDSASLQAQFATAPAHGALTLNPNGSFTYTPAAGYWGPDSFTYVAADGHPPQGSRSSPDGKPACRHNPTGRSNGQPSGTLPVGTVQATLSLTTSEAAACRYATTAGVAYPSMPARFRRPAGRRTRHR